jgi:TRAP-type C4-dicarboxylate transport system permease small subunit
VIAVLVRIQRGLQQLNIVLENGLIFIAGILLCALAVVVMYEVVIRFALSAPAAWSEETARFMLVWFGLLSAAAGCRRGKHFCIRYGVMHFRPKTRWLLRQVANVIVVVVVAILTYEGYLYLDIVSNQTSMATEIDMRIPYAGIPVGFGLILFISILEVVDGLLSVLTGQTFSEREFLERAIYRDLRDDEHQPADSVHP